MSGYLFAGFIILILAGALVALVVTARVYNSTDGERLRKRRTQGPFVPLSAEEIAEDEQRAQERRRSGNGKP
jgi:hypothetical protein